MMVSFDNVKVLDISVDGGKSGGKEVVLYSNEVYLLKYPKSTKDMRKVGISYTTSPLSEYVGSKMYEIIGLPVHKTLIGKKGNHTVVLCKNFCFEGLKQRYKLSTFKDLLPPEVYINSQEALRFMSIEFALEHIKDFMKDRFWEMFIVDFIINNNDRNSGNFGLLTEVDIDVSKSKYALAPVFDNGNSFYGKMSEEQAANRIDTDLISTAISTFFKGKVPN